MANIDYIKNPMWGLRHIALLRVRDPGKRAAISRAIAETKPPKLRAEPEAMARTADLMRGGFVMFPDSFSKDLLMRVRDKLAAKECFEGYLPERRTILLESIPADVNIANVYRPKPISEFREIANHPTLLQIVSECFGKLLFNDLDAWWSLPDREGATCS